MISPHTAPGTHLVVVWQAETADDAASVCSKPWMDVMRAAWRQGRHRAEFRIGQRVVLAAIHPQVQAACGYSAEIQGYNGRYCLEAFDVAALPRSITSLLETVPAKEDA